MPHAEGNFRDVGGASGDEDLERPGAFPALGRAGAKGVHFLHQSLAIEGADRGLVGDHEKNPQRAIRRGEGLILLEGGIAGEGFQGGRDHA